MKPEIIPTVIAVIAVISYVAINIWLALRLIFVKGALDKHMAWINKPGNMWLITWGSLMVGIVTGAIVAEYINYEVALFVVLGLGFPFATFIMLPTFYAGDFRNE